MEVKFNSLFDNDKVATNKFYNINNTDNIGLDPRIKENTLILNYTEGEIEYQKLLNDRRYGNLPVTIISGRPCSTSLANSNKFCESSGRPEILKEIPLTCDNDYIPSGHRGNPKRYIENIDIESRLLNMDYKRQNDSCGTKNFKETNLKSLKCHKDNVLLGDSIKFNYNTKNTIHDPKSNKQCKVYIDEPMFNQSSKRMDTIPW